MKDKRDKARRISVRLEGHDLVRIEKIRGYLRVRHSYHSDSTESAAVRYALQVCYDKLPALNEESLGLAYDRTVRNLQQAGVLPKKARSK